MAYGNFDEKNQCAVVNSHGVDYCLGFDLETAQGASADKAFNLLAYSKGRIVNGTFKPTHYQTVNAHPQADEDGVYAFFRYVKKDGNYIVTNQLGPVMAWEKDNVHRSHYILNGSGGSVFRFGWYTYRTVRTADRTVETLKLYAPEKASFKVFMTLNTVYVDKASDTNMHASVYPNGKRDKGNYMWPLDITVYGRFNGKNIPKEVIKVKYDAVKNTYDIPLRLRKLMGGTPSYDKNIEGLSGLDAISSSSTENKQHP